MAVFVALTQFAVKPAVIVLEAWFATSKVSASPTLPSVMVIGASFNQVLSRWALPMMSLAVFVMKGQFTQSPLHVPFT